MRTTKRLLQSSSNHEKQTLQEYDAFDSFCRLRTGCSPVNADAPGTSPIVIWAGTGELYEAYSGRILAKFDGLDIAKGVRLSDDCVRQLSRKLCWFRDAHSNELLTEYDGQPVTPIRYDCQVFDFQRSGNDNSTITASVLVGPRNVADLTITTRWLDHERLLVQAPVFLDLETPVGRYQAWEFYDYNCDVTFQQPASVVWCRYGASAPFFQNAGVMRFVGQRYERFNELPAGIKDFIEAQYPSFQDPPANMEEVERIEQQQRK